MSQVASPALFNWNGEDIAASAEECALAFRAEREVFNVVGNRDVACPSSETVVGHCDRNRSVFLGSRVKYSQLTVELIDNAALAIRTRPSHVPGPVRSHRRSLAGRDVVGVKIEVSVAIGVEVDRVSDPHWVAARTRAVANFFCVECLQIEDVELIGLASTISRLGSEV